MITPVILCGGSGTRLWPASSDTRPKPFIPLVAGESTFAATLSRVADPALFADPIVVANVAHAPLVAAALKAARRNATVLLEPEGRDSAPAIAAAATMVAADDPTRVLLVLAADHLVPDITGFVAAARAAQGPAESGRIVTFGVAPTYPATGFGYIRPGEPTVWPGVRAVARFVEKPGAQAAAGFVAEGYFWNSGNFMLRADIALSELIRHGGQIASAASRALAEGTVEDGQWRLGASFADAPRVSFDFAVMEKTDRAAVVAARFTWSDLGTWDAVLAASPRDVAGNATSGPVALRDVRRAYVRAESVPVGVIGLDDVVVVATADGVLVASRGRGDGVRQIAAALPAPAAFTGEKPGNGAVSQHSGFAVRTWALTPRDPPAMSKSAGDRHWLVARGSARVSYAGAERLVTAGSGLIVPSGERVTLSCAGATPIAVVETEWSVPVAAEV